ncbi:MAG: peroxiredoxin family protein [Polyangiales bacterium]
MRHSFVLAAVLALGCSSGGGASTGGATASPEASDASDFTLTDIEGKQVSLSQYLGKQAIVVDFWATWCKPCVAELMHVQKMYEARKDKGFVVLAVSMDGPETESAVAPFVKGKGWTFPVLIDTETRATSLYNPRKAAPFTVIIDRHGKIIKRREGFNPGDEVQLEADVDAAMK